MLTFLAHSKRLDLSRNVTKRSFPASTESVPNPIEQAKIVPYAITLPFFIIFPPEIYY